MTGKSADKRFTKDHEWVLLDGDIATVGITDYAQEQLGDLVHIELPELERAVAEGEGWFFRLELDDPETFEALLDQDGYDELLETL